MDETSETESQGRDSKIDNDASAIPAIIIDDYFEEVSTKCSETIRILLTNLNNSAADDLQTLLTVAENLRTNLRDEEERMRQSNKHYDDLYNRLEDTLKNWAVDKETIRGQRSEIEQAWRERDAALLRDQLAQSQVNKMRAKLDAFEIEAKNVNKDKNEELGMSMAKQKESLIRDRDRLSDEVCELNKRIQQQTNQIEAHELKRLEYEEKCRELYKSIDEASTEAFKEKRALDQLRVTFNEISNEKNSLAEQLKNFSSQFETIQANNVQLNLKNGAIKANLLRLTSQYNVTNGKLIKAIADFDDITSKCDQLQIDLAQEQNRGKQKDLELNRLAKDNAQLMKNREAIQKRVQVLEGEKAELEKTSTKLSNGIATIKKEHESSQKAVEKMEKASSTIIRERDTIHRDLKRIEQLADTQKNAIRLEQKQRQSLENDVRTLTNVIEQQQKALDNLKLERDRTVSNTHANVHRIDATQSQLTIKSREIMDLTWELNDTKTKLKHSQQNIDALLVERAALQRNVNVITEDRNDARDRLRTATVEHNKLKQIIGAKSAGNARAMRRIDRIEKEKSTMKSELLKGKVAVQHIRSEFFEKEHERKSLSRSLSEKENQFSLMSQKLDASQNEKDRIDEKLVKRNMQNHLLQEKLDIMQAALDRGEMEYNNRLEDIRLLKIEIKNLRAKKNLLTRSLCNTIDVRQEVLQLNRDLTQERVKARALEEEMSTPMNVHRWRKLCGKDPERMDLIVKVQMLTKRVLYQTAIRIEKENALRQSTLLCETLKSAIEQFSNNESIKQELCFMRRATTAKTRRLKALSAEHNIKDSEIKRKNQMVEELRADLFEKKEILLREKRDKQKLQSQLDAIKHQINTEHLTSNLATSNLMTYQSVGIGMERKHFL